MVKVIKTWTNNLKSDSDIEEFKLRLVHSQDVLERLGEIIEGKRKANIAEMTKKTSYDSPAWSEQTADRLGYLRALEDLLALTIINTKEK